MFQKIAFLFCTVGGMFMVGMVAWADNGLTIDRQPGVAIGFIVGLLCALAGGVLLRGHKHRVELTAAGLGAAIMTALAVKSENPLAWVIPLGLVVGSAVDLFRKEPAPKKPNLKLVA